MTYKSIENKVIKQSKLLAKEVEKILSTPNVMEGKFIAYLDGSTVFGDTHEECYIEAEKKFGKNSGFALSEISNKKLVASCLVKLK